MWGGLLGLAGKLLGPVFNVIDQYVEDKDKANALKAQLQSQFLENAAKELESQRDIIVAEATGHSWLQRNWRPLTMLAFVGIIVNNYVLFPYAQAFGVPIPFLEVPVDLWDVIKIGLGGYVVGRSAEKVAKDWKK